MLSLLLLLANLSIAQTTECEALYADRGASLARSEAAYACFEKQVPTDNVTTARRLNRLAYLKFFMAEHFLESKTEMLLEAIALAEKSMLVFGKKYDLAAYRALMSEEKEELAWALYHYGLATSLYVDIKGIAEALRRMDDIKRSMSTILRIEQFAVAHSGAHRTLGIFHMKVPVIAGGDIEISKTYLPLAVNSTLRSGGLSVYPINNSVYADLLYKLGQKEAACAQLRMVAELTDSDVAALDNGFDFETRVHVREAKKNLRSRQCP